MHSAHARTQGGAVSLRRTLRKAQFLAGDVLARSCAADWRACQPGDVYFALTTADGDGHEAAPQAIQRGAAAIVAERLLPVPVPQVLVPDTRVALGRVCHALAGHPSRDLTTIGVTGSAGKTCVAMLLASILEAAGQAAGVMSSFGHSDSLAQSIPPAGTPTTAEYADWLRRMQLARCPAAVLELPSQALAERRTSGIGLDIALVTNIKNDGLAEHNSAAAYQKVIRRVFGLLKSGGVAILNADDHRSRNWLASGKRLPPACLTYALHAEADITAAAIERSAAEQTFLLSVGAHTTPVRTRIIGNPHISNCLAAAAAAIALGIDLSTIVRGLEAVERLPGRMERMECGQPFSVFVDAAAGPQSLSQTIKSVRQVTSGRVIAVYGSARPHESARRALIGRVLERGTHRAIFTGAEPTASANLHAAHDYLDGFERPQRGHIIPNRLDAIHFALSQARPGDAIAILGRDDRGAAEEGTDGRIAADRLYGRSLPSRPRLRVVGL